jgi:D-alanine-D-alanine ligase
MNMANGILPTPGDPGMSNEARETILIIHDYIPAESAPDQQDVLVQADNVRQSLRAAGYRVETYGLTADFGAFTEEILKRRPTAVVNLVETVDNSVALAHVPLLILDRLGIPYTGAGADALYLTSNKVLAKKLMPAHDIPTPRWWAPDGVIHANDKFGIDRVIIKRIWEDASVDITDDCVKSGSLEDIISGLVESQTQIDSFFVEEFIEGREINAGLIEDTNGDPQILPAAEILFQGFPPGKPTIVNYSAKWDAQSFEYTHTPRTFCFSGTDEPILRKLIHYAQTCWRVFDLRGYARVDFRVDSAGNPWVLEINANPCISPDAGFFAAFREAGLGGYDELTKMLVNAAMRNRVSSIEERLRGIQTGS